MFATGLCVFLQLNLTQYNVDQSGSINYLSAGESLLPTIYFVICGVFVLEAVVWGNYLKKNLYVSAARAVLCFSSGSSCVA